MKKLFFALLLFPFILNAQQKYERIFYKLSDDIEFKILSYSKGKMMDVGATGTGGTFYEKAKKDHQLILLWFKIENKGNETIMFDLTQFQVVDENSNVYDAYLCAGNGLNMKYCESFEFKIKPNKGRQARIYFLPQIPKNVELKYLRVNGVDMVEF